MAATSGAIRAGRAFVELFTDNKKLVAGLRAAQQRLRAFGLGAIRAGGALIGVGAAVAAPLIGAVKNFAAVGDELNKMSARTGVSTAALSQLGFAAEQSGSNLATIEKGIRKMQQTVGEAADGTATYVDELEKLGLSFNDLQGLGPEEQFTLIGDRLSEIEDPTLKAASALAIFGRAGTQLIPLFAGGADAVQKMRQEAIDLGLSVSESQAQSAADFTDAWNRIIRSAKAAFFVIGSQLAPMLTDLLGKIKPVAKAMIDFAQDNGETIRTIFKVAVAVIGAGAALTGIGIAIVGVSAIFGGMATIISTITTVFSGLVSPIGLAAAAIVSFGALLLTTTENGGALLDWFAGRFAALLDVAKETWGAISNAIAAGDIEAAMAVVTASIEVTWLTLKTALVEIWEGFRLFWSELTASIGTVAISVVAEIQKAWVTAIAAIEKRWKQFKQSGFTEQAASALAGIVGGGAVTSKGPAAALLTTKAGPTTQEIRDVLKDDFARGRATLPAELAEIDAATAKQKAEIEALKKSAQEGLQADKASTDEAAGKRVAAAEEALAAAQKARADAISAASQLERVGVKGGRPPTLDESIAAGAKAAEAKITARGTFSAFAAGRLGATDASRTAEATEQIADSNEEISQGIIRLQRMGVARIA